MRGHIVYDLPLADMSTFAGKGDTQVRRSIAMSVDHPKRTWETTACGSH